MPVRDPSTGKFVSAQDHGFADLEVVTATAIVGRETADSESGQGDDLPAGFFFEGEQLIDYDEIVDRNESLELLSASHQMIVYARENQGAPGVVRAAAEVSASPSRQAAFGSLTGDVLDTANGPATRFRKTDDDSIDLIGRAMSAVVYPPFLDTDAAGYGLGGAGSAGVDEIDIEGFPEEIAQFHPRDELFLNGMIESSGFGGGEYLEVKLQHLYGVIES